MRVKLSDCVFRTLTALQLKSIHSWWLQYLAGLVGVSSLGASITFGVLTTSNTGPDALSGRFGSGTVRNFLAIAFLLFLVTIGCGSLFSSLLFFHEESNFASDDLFRQEFSIWKFRARFNKFLHFCNLVITLVMLVAFIMLALVIVAYTEGIGWVTLAVVCAYAIIYFVLWSYQL